jgi:hypothetical protein
MPRLPINYNNTIIYKIVCRDINVKELYVGHTTDFKSRKQLHKYDSKKSMLIVYQCIRENGGWDNWDMIEIEKYNCNDFNEACSRERYYIETLQATLNKNIPNRKKPEYYIDKREERLAYQYEYYKKDGNYTYDEDYQRKYREENKEVIAECKRKMFVCECGRTLRWCGRSVHLKSKCHLDATL